jgi:hypothetical protein
MPLCHFVFGSLYREGRPAEQAKEFIDKILLPRSLKAFPCPEFLPMINNPGAIMAVPKSAVELEKGGVSLTRWAQSPPVFLLPSDVWMISFCDVPLKKLYQWGPSNHYGQLGIAFTNDFKRRHGIRNVQYYKLQGLEKDKLVKEFNAAVSRSDDIERKKLSRTLLGFRKPDVLWQEFKELFGSLKMSVTGEGNTKIDHITYSRYETGYIFRYEREARWVTEEGSNFLPFEEKDVLKLIVPNLDVGAQVKDALEASWTHVPEVIVYPSCS